MPPSLDEILGQLRRLVEENSDDADSSESEDPNNFRCEDCVDCTNCRFCNSCEGCDDCTYCENAVDCRGCTQGRDLLSCTACTQSVHSAYCDQSSYVTLCYACSMCVHCFACVGLEGAEFCILNEQYSRREYFQAVAGFREELESRRATGTLEPWFSDEAIASMGPDAGSVQGLTPAEATQPAVAGIERTAARTSEGGAASDSPEQRAGGYGTEPRAEGYGTEPRAEGYGAEPRAEGYGAEEGAGGYGTEQRAEGYGAEPRAEGYGAEPRAEGYGAEPRAEGHGAEPRTQEAQRRGRRGASEGAAEATGSWPPADPDTARLLDRGLAEEDLWAELDSLTSSVAESVPASAAGTAPFVAQAGTTSAARPFRFEPPVDPWRERPSADVGSVPEDRWSAGRLPSRQSGPERRDVAGSDGEKDVRSRGRSLATRFGRSAEKDPGMERFGEPASPQRRAALDIGSRPGQRRFSTPDKERPAAGPRPAPAEDRDAQEEYAHRLPRSTGDAE